HALQMRLYDGARSADAVAKQIAAMRESVGALDSASPEIRTASSALSAVLGAGAGGRAGRRGGGAAPGGPADAGRESVMPATTLPSFDAIRESMNHLLEEIDSADMAPTPAMTGAYAAACSELRGGLVQWRAIQTKQLAALNAALTAGQARTLPVPPAV